MSLKLNATVLYYRNYSNISRIFFLDFWVKSRGAAYIWIQSNGFFSKNIFMGQNVHFHAYCSRYPNYSYLRLAIVYKQKYRTVQLF